MSVQTRNPAEIQIFTDQVTACMLCGSQSLLATRNQLLSTNDALSGSLKPYEYCKLAASTTPTWSSQRPTSAKAAAFSAALDDFWVSCRAAAGGKNFMVWWGLLTNFTLRSRHGVSQQDPNHTMIWMQAYREVVYQL